MRNDLNNYDPPTGLTHIGLGLQLGQLQLEPPADPDGEPDTNDYAVLLSDGAANGPRSRGTRTAPATHNDFYLDVNDNGIRDSGDDLASTTPIRE